MMNAADFIALAPLLAVAAGALVVTALVMCRRCRPAIPWASAATLLAGILLVPFAATASPRGVTALLDVDGYALFFQTLILASALATTPFTAGYLETRRPPGEGLYHGEYHLLLLLATIGAAVLAAAAHFASFILGLELISVSLFALIAYPGDARSVEAGIKYLVLAGVSVAMLLFGLALVYAASGSLAFAELPERLGDASAAPSLAGIGFALVIAGLGFKLSLAPFHQWTPDVYQGAPAPVSAFIATVSKAAVFAVLLRYLVVSGALDHPAVSLVVGIVAAVSMLVGNLLALRQQRVKRILGYSSIAHLGYLLVALLAGGERATEAVAVYLTAYAITMLGAFGAVALLSAPEGEADDLHDYRGLFRRRPALATLLTLMLLSLAGVPVTAGFVGKFYLFVAGVGNGLWTLLALLVIGSALGLYYYLRVVVAMWQPAEQPVPAVPGRGGMSALALLAVLLLGIGIYPEPLIQIIHTGVLAAG